MRKGLTLTELLVATILIGIVMTGVAAFSLFVKQARDSTGAGTILAVQTATAMHYLAEDANKAVGDNSNRGVAVDPADQLSICFRHDVSDPASYADDTWACYWYDAATDGLWKCADRGAGAPVPPANFTGCQTGTGEVRLVTLDRAAANYFKVVDDANGRFNYVDITLNTIANPARAANTITNPTYQLFTRVSPPAHGR
ncbi:MAG: prepilin-type N-terminal cleavage/methylation domain-containing protein [Candidatus Omnitrophica bacterium]|nr:prepilin-type N-terminal cleavage/methylation domain-containing protein [Candidatus Omnitrophota bacterium]